jgi:hypothetical protein
MPDDHSELVPLLPIPNRTVKRLSADDSADARVKVGHRQASTAKTPSLRIGRFFWPLKYPLVHLHQGVPPRTELNLWQDSEPRCHVQHHRQSAYTGG